MRQTAKSLMTGTILSLAVAVAMGANANAASNGVKAGFLKCDVAGNLSFVFGSSREITCVYDAGTGTPIDHYKGTIKKYGIDPDLTILGKVVGGGLPAAAYGGSRALMEQIAPAGPVYQAGTLSGNPLAMAAGLATLEVLSRPGVWERAEAWARRAEEAIASAAAAAGVAVTVQRVGTMLTPFFGAEPVRDYAAARRTDRAAYARFFHAMLDAGVYLAPSAFEAAFTSTMHGAAELATLEAALASAWPR